MEYEKIRHLLMRFALSFVFISFGAWEVINPQYWQGFVPSFIQHFFIQHIYANVNILVIIHGIVLFVVGLALLLGFYMKIASILAALMLIEINLGLLLDSGFSDLFVRDFALLIIAAALYFDTVRHLTINKH